MTLKEMDKKLKSIKRQVSKLEKEIELKKKSKKEKYTSLEEWLDLGKEISKVWDKNVSVEDEMRYERSKE